MANEIQFDAPTGKTCYAQVRNAAGQVWRVDTLVFENYATANIAHYNVPATEQGTASGFYAGNFPAVGQGVYSVDAKVQAGGSPAEADATVGTGTVEWTGSALLLPVDLTLAVPTSNTAQTVGDALNAARAQGFGKWTIVGTALTLFAADGVTVVRTFTLDSATAPTQRA
jgi:hypothetical protein